MERERQNSKSTPWPFTLDLHSSLPWGTHGTCNCPISVRCSVWQCFHMCSSALQCVAVCCSVLQCVAVCCFYPDVRTEHVNLQWRARLRVCVCVCARARVRVRGRATPQKDAVVNTTSDSVVKWGTTCWGCSKVTLGNSTWTSTPSLGKKVDYAVMTLCNTLQCTATHFNALQHTSMYCNALQCTATHFNALQHTSMHCNTLQCTATHFNTLQHTPAHLNALQHTATHCNTLQHTATHCNTLPHTGIGRCRKSSPCPGLAASSNLSALQRVAVCCSVLQCVAVCCSVV